MISIEKATVADSELIARIGSDTFLESHGHSASAEDIESFITKTYNKEAIKAEFNNPNAHYYIILVNGKVAGFSKVEINAVSPFVQDVNITKLQRIYLLKAFYGQNLGAKLFDFNIEFSKENSQQGIWLAVWVENKRAISFYKKKGFKIVGAYDFEISETHSNPNHIMYLEY
jgi:ribosomal protein S18 acetylase RimI-like enzyme